MNKLAALSLAILTSACEVAAPFPTSPTPTVTDTPSGTVSTATYTLSGVVYEFNATGLAPIEGVEVYCDSCGSPEGHTFVFTDRNGFYRLEWAGNGVHPLFVTKPGYEHSSETRLDAIGRVIATVAGDTQLDVELVRR